MTLPKSGKLVRDRIPEIVAASGNSPEISVLSAEDYREALHLKLAEEAHELREAPASTRLEELTDVFEVVNAMATAYGFTLDNVAARAHLKREDRGGFEERIWMSARTGGDVTQDAKWVLMACEASLMTIS